MEVVFVASAVDIQVLGYSVSFPDGHPCRSGGECLRTTVGAVRSVPVGNVTVSQLVGKLVASTLCTIVSGYFLPDV